MKEIQLNHFYRSWRQTFYGDDTLADFKSMKQRVKRKRRRCRKKYFLAEERVCPKPLRLKELGLF